MDETERLLYQDIGILPPDTVRKMSFFILPFTILGTIIFFIGSIWLKEWILIIVGLLFLGMGLISLFGLNTVEVWVSNKHIIRKDKPFDFYPHTPICIKDIKQIVVIPMHRYKLIKYAVILLFTNGREEIFTETKSQEQALEIAKLLSKQVIETND